MGQTKDPGVTSHAPGSAKSVREWTLTHPSELPLWELESQMDSRESSEHDCKGQNPSARRVFYIIEKLLKFRCLKWSRIAHLDIWNTSYGQKKGRESNWQFDFWPLKVENRPNLRATYLWKDLNEGYNFAFDRIAIRGLHKKLWAPKVAGVQMVGILGLPLGSPRTKSHLDVASVERCRVYYKGKGGGFPQVRVVVNLMCSSCPWFILAPKVFQLCTNHFILVLCRFVWVSEACQFFLVSSRSSSTPLYPSKVLWARECALTPYSFVVFQCEFT
jgi:hypothetical protein